jgi:hypothetical protein
LALVAHLAQRKLVLIFQVGANAGAFAIVLAALGEFVILAPVQAVDLVVEIVSQLCTGICWFGLAGKNNCRRREQKGPDYKGISFGKPVHMSMPSWALSIWLPCGQVG